MNKKSKLKTCILLTITICAAMEAGLAPLDAGNNRATGANPENGEGGNKSPKSGGFWNNFTFASV